MQLAQKLTIPYQIKDENPNPILDMDSKNGSVKMVWNTYNYLDSDGDILVNGCSSKSISERGVNATTAAIKHALFHDVTRLPGKLTYLAEEPYEHNGKAYMGIIAVSKLALNTEEGRDTFLKYEAGIYDNHSIGYRYMDINYVEPDTDAWNQLEQSIVNPSSMAQSAVRFGGVWTVKEIKLYEGSTVAFGANEMTPVLGIKSLDEKSRDSLLHDQFKKMDKLTKALQKGLFTDETMNDFEIQYKQCQQIIYELSQSGPLKGTHEGREYHPDNNGGFDLSKINQNLFNHGN